MAALETPLSIQEFLAEDARKELLRFSTAGSVDDGKSTLIGRLLYDSKSVYEDQLAAVRSSKVNRAAGPIDFSLLTDGLRAEREQGITIDVAYRYFSTPRRKFIIADTPGHEQYTRNMATGASTADLALILTDAQRGLTPQSRRHACIAALLGIPHLLVAVNKMDLVDFRREVFEDLAAQFRKHLEGLEVNGVEFVPVSALEGDNIVRRSQRMPWYTGPSLLEILETVPVGGVEAAAALRFPVQYVQRPNADFRGYAGQLASGRLRPGDAVMVLPSGRLSRVRSLPSFDGEVAEARAPMSVTVCLEDEVDISRGDMLVPPYDPPRVARQLEARLVWMSEKPLRPGVPYLLKHTTQTVTATVEELHHRLDVNTLEGVPAGELQLNEIGLAALRVNRPLFFDSYRANRTTGSFILIDPLSNSTVGAGMIQDQPAIVREPERTAGAPEFQAARLTAGERLARNGHAGAAISLGNRPELAYALERRLFELGCQVVAVEEADTKIAAILAGAGFLALFAGAVEAPGALVFPPESLPASDEEAAGVVINQMYQRGILRGGERLVEGEGI